MIFVVLYYHSTSAAAGTASTTIRPRIRHAPRLVGPQEKAFLLLLVSTFQTIPDYPCSLPVAVERGFRRHGNYPWTIEASRTTVYR